MIRSLLDFLNVKPEERVQVLLMLGAGFFMGIFFATYSVVAESLFLSTLGNELNKAFIVSGFFGIIATVMFSFAQNKIKFSNLVTFVILLIVAITLSFYIGYHYGPESYKLPIIFLMFCMTGPITAVLLLSYWGTFGRLFNFKQSKRIIGWIDTGQLIAVIIANFLIPVTASLFGETDNYLIVCCISIALTAIHFLAISFRFPLIKNDPKEMEANVIRETSLAKVVSDPYTKLLSIFLIISMVVLILGQFSFQELIKVQYPNQNELTNFLAFFNLTIYGLSFVMQTFVNDRIISNYGIRIALLILPVILLFFTVFASFSGLVFGYTKEMAPQSFIYFFLFIALIRLFNTMLRDSLENPMFKLLFIPIDDRYRFGIQAKVEGIINETGRFAAGGLILLFGLLPFFKLIWMPILLTVLGVLYYLIINKLYSGYKNKIRAKLEDVQTGSEKLELGTSRLAARLEKSLSSESPGQAVFAFKLLEKINPLQIASWVNQLMRHPSEGAKDFAQRKMNEIKGLSVSDRYVIRFDRGKTDVSNRSLLTKAELELLINSGGDITKSRILRLARSTDPGDRQYAAELLLHTITDENLSFLIELLNDPDAQVRSTAITTAIRKNSTEVIHSLIENLSNPQFSNQAMNALVLIGSKALNQLDSAFYRSGQPTHSLVRIVQILGRIGGQRAKDLLWNKIDYPDKVVVSKVLLAMGEAGFKAGSTQMSRIRYAIENDIQDISWNFSALTEIEDSAFGRQLKEALRAEIANDITHVYMLLAMLYDARSIQLVKENIESGTVEGIAFAVELLDIFLSEQLKVRVIPVLDDLSDQERISRLEVFYPRARLDERLVLKFLINRDFTQANRWTKSCVLRQIGEMRITEFTLDLIAQLFNPDRMIREMAAWSLYQINESEYKENLQRLDFEEHRRIDRVVLTAPNRHLRIFEKTLFLLSIPTFKGMSGLSISFLAEMANEITLTKGKPFVLDQQADNNFYVVYSGTVAYFEQGQRKQEFQSGHFIAEVLPVEGSPRAYQLLPEEDSILLAIGKNEFYELLSENVVMAEQVLDYA